MPDIFKAIFEVQKSPDIKSNEPKLGFQIRPCQRIGLKYDEILDFARLNLSDLMRSLKLDMIQKIIDLLKF